MQSMAAIPPSKNRDAGDQATPGPMNTRASQFRQQVQKWPGDGHCCGELLNGLANPASEFDE